MFNRGTLTPPAPTQNAKRRFSPGLRVDGSLEFVLWGVDLDDL